MRDSKRVLVAMSGGVDSSATAALLQEEGFDVIGITMQLLERSHNWGGCCGLDGIEDAKRVAHKLGIPHYVVNFREIFREKVISNFCEEYKHGRTPNPCIRCNQYLKFEDVLKKADELGAEYIATGHYARIEHDPHSQRDILKKGIDSRKDQSYFLYVMKQAQLRRTLMPLGNLTKDRVRQIAVEKELPVANKPESQEICFIPDNKYREFLKQHIPEAIIPGAIVDAEGKVIGQHQGIPFYTIGQRRGLGISAPEPLYVNALVPESNTIVAGRKADVYGDSLVASELNWIAVKKLSQPLDIKVRIRYLHQEADAVITPLDEDNVQITFQTPQMAITPGQAVVFYDEDTVVGGGTIIDTQRV